MSALRPTEAACERTIVQAAIVLGWRVDGRRQGMTQKGAWATQLKGHAGFPDLTFARPGYLWFVELKRLPNTVEPEQQKWLDVLPSITAGHHIRTFVLWVPEHQDAFINGPLTDPASLTYDWIEAHPCPRTPRRSAASSSPKGSTQRPSTSRSSAR